MEDTPTTAAPGEEICLVCNDASTGYHYGTPSCNGCKTFFRRTVTKKQTFVCQYGGGCIIDKSVRCACRHCRFEKCLAVGMSKDAIQQNRDPIGYTKRTRRYPPVRLPAAASISDSGPAVAAAGASTHSTSTQNSPHNDTAACGSGETGHAADDRMLEELASIEQRVQIVRNSQIFVQKSFWEIMLQRSILHDHDLVEKQGRFPHSDAQLRRAKNSDHQYWHERDWVIMIEWAKTIPVFETLSFSDRLVLLRNFAFSYPALNQCFYTKVVDLDTIVFPDGSFFDRTQEPDRPVSLQRKKIKVFNNLLRPIRKMQLDMREFAAAKTIFFLNPDSDDLSAEVRTQINEARCAITNALFRYMIGKGTNSESVDRFAKLLLLGTAISTIVVESKEAVVVANFFEQIQFSKLAKQLLLNMKEDELDAAAAAAAADGRAVHSASDGGSVAQTESDTLSEQSPCDATIAANAAEAAGPSAVPPTEPAMTISSENLAKSTTGFTATTFPSSQRASHCFTNVPSAEFLPSAFTSYLPGMASAAPQLPPPPSSFATSRIPVTSSFRPESGIGAFQTGLNPVFDVSAASARLNGASAAAAMSSFLAAAASQHPTIMRSSTGQGGV